MARLLAAVIGARIEGLWERISRMPNPQNEAARLLGTWFRDELDRAWCQFQSDMRSDRHWTPADVNRDDPDQREQWERRSLGEQAAHRLDMMQAEFKGGSYSYGYPVAREIMSELDVPFNERDHRFTLLAAEAMKAKAEIEEARIRWSTGEYVYRPEWMPRLSVQAFPVPHALPAIPTYLPSSPPPPIASPAPVATTVAGPTLAEAILDHIRSVKRQTNPTARDLQQRDTHLQLLVGAFGSDRQVASISRAEAGNFFKALQELPSHFMRNKRLSGLSFFAMAAKARELGLKPMHNRTVNSYVGDARGLFTEAVKTGQMERNPFDSMSMVEDGFTENTEKPWKPEQQERLFSSPLFMGCASARAVYEPGAFLLSDWRFWTPLIALTSGARVSEIAQLRPCDIRQDGDIWYIDISLEGGRRLKNRSSKRRTPVHSQLVRLGLPELAARQEKARAPLLLPGVPKPIQGSPSHGLTKWMREDVGPRLIPDRALGQGWHSWRHCLQDLSRVAGNPDSVTDRIAGRTPEGTGGRYGAYGLEMLRDALEKIVFPSWLAAIPIRV